MRIGIDLMGSDTLPAFLFEAVLKAAKQLDHTFTLVALVTQQVANELAALHPAISPLSLTAQIEFYIVHEVILMSEEPLIAIRRKKGSSLAIGIRLLKKKLLDGFISAGNTGALVALARLSLPLLPHIKRLALLAILPTEKGPVAVVDVGGHLSCHASHLIQIAKIGIAYQRQTLKIALPRVGLLNIGSESKKGTRELRQTYQVLEENQTQMAISFQGNIEAREVFQAKVDVLVTDGFTGNILLKSIEGTSLFMLDYMIKHEQSSCLTFIKDLKKKFNYAEYPGALVCGVEGLIIKCHGNTSPLALFHSIMRSISLLRRNVIFHMKKELEK